MSSYHLPYNITYNIVVRTYLTDTRLVSLSSHANPLPHAKFNLNNNKPLYFGYVCTHMIFHVDLTALSPHLRVRKKLHPESNKKIQTHRIILMYVRT